MKNYLEMVSSLQKKLRKPHANPERLLPNSETAKVTVLLSIQHEVDAQQGVWIHS